MRRIFLPCLRAQGGVPSAPAWHGWRQQCVAQSRRRANAVASVLVTDVAAGGRELERAAEPFEPRQADQVVNDCLTNLAGAPAMKKLGNAGQIDAERLLPSARHLRIVHKKPFPWFLPAYHFLRIVAAIYTERADE